MAAWPTPAQALITPVTLVAGPSASIVGVGNVAMAGDGSGGVVFEMVSGGVPHIFVSQYLDQRWSPPIQVDVGQSGPASFPAIAAGDGGELLVVWTQPWASESIGGQTPTTYYQLMSSELQPGAQSFGPAEQVDPNNVGDGTGVYPALTMAPDGAAYVVYRVVTNPLTPDEPQPPGTITPMRPGDELVDVRVARYNGQFWSSMGAVNVFPGQVTMRTPSASNAPAIAIDRGGQGIVVWQEPTVDGVARIWARRLFGTTLGDVLEVSPETIDGEPVSVDADAPSVALGQNADAEVVFRLDGGAGSPLLTPYEFVNSLSGSYSATGAGSFGAAVPLAGASTVGAPSVATDAYGGFQAAFTAGGASETVSGQGNGTNGNPDTLGRAKGDPALAAFDPNGGGAVVWPGTNASGQPVVQVHQTFPGGRVQTASLSAPTTGPVSSLTLGRSGAGDALIAFLQGFGETSQVAVATVQAPAAGFTLTGPLGWVKPSHAILTWGPARATLGPVRYSVVLDGRTIAAGLRERQYQLPARGLGSGRYRVQIIATDDAAQQTPTPVARLKVDASPPEVTAEPLAQRRVRVRLLDAYSGVRGPGTVIAFGDGTVPVRNELTAVHRYRASGRYLVTIHCASMVGNRAVDHLWVRIP